MESAHPYRLLFENSPLPLWLLDFTRIEKHVDTLSGGDPCALRACLTRHPNRIRDCLERIVVRDVNRAAVQLFHAGDKNYFLAHWLRIVRPETLPTHLDTLCAIARHETHLKTISVFHDLTGRRLEILLHWWADNGDTDPYRSIVQSAIDITAFRHRPRTPLRPDDPGLESPANAMTPAGPGGAIAGNCRALCRMPVCPDKPALAGFSIHDGWWNGAIPRHLLGQLLKTGGLSGILKTRLQTGRPVAMRFSLSLILGQTGRPAPLAGLAIDGGLSGRTPLAAGPGEDLFRAAFDILPDAVVILMDGMLLHANPATLRLMKTTNLHDHLWFPCDRFIAPEYRDRHRTRSRDALDNGRTQPFVPTRLLRPDGKPVDAEVSSFPFEYRGRRALLTVIRSGGWKQWMENKLVEQRDKLRALALRLIASEENERRRIAAILHDSINQQLVFSKMQVDRLANSLPDPLRKDLDAIAGELEKAIGGIQNLTFDLCHPDLRLSGLIPALRNWLDGEFSTKNGLRVSLRAGAGLDNLEHDLAAFVFRSVRELATNTARHARAHRLSIRLTRRKSLLTVRVADDGVGLPPRLCGRSQTARTGYGLLSIREKLSYLGGTIAFETAPGGGTVVILDIPC